ncbi:unnamed protein product [Heterobilharzia americana]|nr:unnamed protein product [Heterobilharzia americana]
MVKLNDLIGVNTECLTSLDRRCNGEYIDDPVFKELNQERNLLKDDLYNNLQLQINEAFHILIELNDVSQLFYPDITNKNEAIDIDIDVYNMNEKSSSVTFKPFYDHSSQQLLDLQTWENISRETLEKAKIIMNKADDLLHRLHNSLHITINRIANKTGQVNGVLRMRSYDTLRALREIEYQLKSTEKERDEHLKDIYNLEDTIRDKRASLKLAETRLEKRQDRSGNENIKDAPQVGLLDEISGLQDSITVLEEKLAQSRSILHKLEEQITQLCYDTQKKRESLQIYEEIQNIRRRLEHSPSITSLSCPMIPVSFIREPIIF